MAEVATNACPIHERPLGSCLHIADAGKVIHVLMDPVEHGEHLRAAFADRAKLAVGEQQEAVGRTVTARRQVLQLILRQVEPVGFARRRGKPDAQPVVHHRFVDDADLALETRAKTSLAPRIGKILNDAGRRRDDQPFRLHGLIRRMRHLHRDDGLRARLEIKNEFSANVEMHEAFPGMLLNARRGIRFP